MTDENTVPRVLGSDITMADGLRSQVRNRPDKVAVVFEDRSMTYGELGERTSRLANALLDMGLKKGDRVAIYSTNRIEYVEFYFGLAKAGLVSVPISFHLKEEELLYQAGHADCKAILVEPLFLQRLEGILDRLEYIGRDRVIVYDVDQPPEGMKSYNALLAGASPQDPLVFMRWEEPFYIGYTAGTTGRAKGAVISHRARINAVVTGSIEWCQIDNDVTLIIAPLYHAAPMAFMLGHVFIGALTVIMRNFDAEQTLANIERHRVSNFFAVPTIFNFLFMLDPEVQKKYDLGSMRRVISAGAPLHLGAKQKLLEFLGSDIGLHEFYGGSETGMAVNLPPQDTIRKNGSVGQGVAGVDLKILDDDRNELPPGQPGEIFMRTPCLMTEYDKDQQKTADAFYGDYMTLGDVGYLDDDGFLYLVDRKADMVLSGGVNIYPKEIEDVLSQHPSVMQAVVIGVPDDVWGEALKALIVPAADADLTEAEVMEFVKSRLAGMKVPKSVEFITDADLPKSPVGKILKREIRGKYWKDRDRKI